MKNITHELGRLLRHYSKQPKAPTLGQRELEVMKIFWQGNSLSAKQVIQNIPDSKLSLSTMQSTLERLHRKELLYREKDGRFYVYRAAVSRSEIITQLLGDISEQISDGQMAPMISGFMAFVGKETTGTESETLATEVQDAIEQNPTDHHE